MFMVFDDDRPSESPFVERVWRCHSERSGTFLSVAAIHWEMVVTRLGGRTVLTVRGPETRPTERHCPGDGEWFAIRFKAGTFMPRWPVPTLIDGSDVNLPHIGKRGFLLDGTAWEYPDFDNAETFVARLVRAGLVKRDLAVQAALQGDSHVLSRRSSQRRFLQATGMTCATMRQIERARHAVNLLRNGVCIADTVHLAGLYDQAHLTRSLRRFIGLTPARIVRAERQLSFLYNTTPVR